MKPRKWQIAAKAKFEVNKTKSFLLDVTPGAGKTMFAAMCAELLFEQRRIDFVVSVVPNTAIKGDKDAGFLGDWNAAGIQITTVLKDGKDRPMEYRGAVITYSQLPNMIATFNTWVHNGVRLFAIFDEIHHASDNVWGAATEELGRIAVNILSMTGTCFRSDGHRISFVEYDANDLAVPDYRYGYRQAVTDRICRKVDFITDDSLTEFELDKEEYSVRVSEAKLIDDVRGATATLFRADHDYLRRVLEKASDCLEQYRSWDRDAGGLIVCRSGKDDNDNRHLNHVAQLIRDTLGEEPEVISYDDKDANAKIERFRKSDQRWICAVRKISEGVDIKRLRVEVMATRPTSELLFRQLVGRVVRVDDDKRPGDATVFLARFPQLVAWASTIAEEAKAGLADQRPDGNGGNKPGEPRSFSSRAATHEDGGAISDFGEEFAADEINAAERLRGDDPQLADVSITILAHLQRKLGVVVEPMIAPKQPLQIEKKKVRVALVKKQRRLAIQRNPKIPDFGKVWREIGDTFGPYNADDLTDNYSIEIMRQVDAWLMATIEREFNVKQ
jgi:superfamily II DNA or RNA helicase